MFCPNCGNPVSKEDNFCPNCGKKLKEFPTYGIHSQPEQTLPHSMDETRVFHPKALDGIDTTDDIKNIIHAVDEKISENIKKYESQKFVPLTEDQLSEKNTSSMKEKTSHHRDPDQFHMSQSELVRRVQEELKREGYDESKVDRDFDEIFSQENPSQDDSEQKDSNPNIKEKKHSLKTIWKNFINEDDDEYSIFSGLNNTSSDKEIEKERNLEVTATVNTGEHSWEDTMSVPKIVTTEEMEEAEEIVEKQLQEKKESNRPLEEPISVSASKKEGHITSPSTKKDSKSTTSNKDTLKETPSLEEKKLTSSFSITKYKEKLLKKNTSSKQQNQSKENRPKQPKKEQEKNSVFASKEKSSTSIWYSCIDRLSQMTENFSLSVKNLHSKEAKLLIIIGILLTLVPIILAERAIAISTILFLALRLVFDRFEYYIPLKVATDRGFVNTSAEQIKLYTLLNWAICKLILFIGFLFSPFGGFFTFPLINALTAMPICTVIISVLSPAIALSLYWKQLRHTTKVDFVGWYSLIFILFELFFKLVWFFIHFIFNTLF